MSLDPRRVLQRACQRSVDLSLTVQVFAVLRQIIREKRYKRQAVGLEVGGGVVI